MSDNGAMYTVSSYPPGIRIIPAEDIRNGYKRTVGDDIFVSPGNYRLMKPLTAKGTIIMLGFLKEQVNDFYRNRQSEETMDDSDWRNQAQY